MPQRQKQRDPQRGRRAQARDARRARALTRKRRRRIFLWVAVTIGSLALIVGLVLPSLPIGPGGGQGSTTGPGERIPIMGNDHILPGQDHNPYNSIPPTSGPHYDSEMPWGVYQEPQVDERVVHNLEHGGVVFNYNLSDQPTIDGLVKLVQEQSRYPCYLLAQPYPKLPPGKIVLTAWGVLQEFGSVDAAGMQAFVDAYRNKGPEQVACTP